MRQIFRAGMLALFLLTPPCLHAAEPAMSRSASPPFCDYRLPEMVSLCGEVVPLDRATVRQMLEREFIISVWDQAQVFLWLKRAGRYFPHIEQRLAKEGMPDDLKYVAIAESALLTHISSDKGARGPWQFMRHTGRHNGLRKTRYLDERLNFELSTESALQYLNELHRRFGSWTLALAAYNCGMTRLQREIREQRVNDYYRLNLPLETERYVFRIVAAKIIMENPQRYGYVLRPDSRYSAVPVDTVSLELSAALHIADLAETIGTDFKTIKELNPELTGYHIPAGTHSLKFPPGTGKTAEAAVHTLNKKVAAATVYHVKPGDTLSHIAARSGMSVARLMDLNGLRNTCIYVGQKLRVHP